MADSIKSLIVEAREAAAAVEAANERSEHASSRAERADAEADAAKAQARLDELNLELVERTGEVVTEDGSLRRTTGFDSDAAERRQLAGGAEATADLSDAEIQRQLDAKADEQTNQSIDEIVERRTGKSADEVDPETARRAIREEGLEAAGVRIRPVIGVDPLDRTDEQIAEHLDEQALKMQVGELLDKPASEVTGADIANVRQQAIDAQVEANTGKAPEDLTAVERAQAESVIRNREFEARLQPATDVAVDAGATGEEGNTDTATDAPGAEPDGEVGAAAPVATEPVGADEAASGSGPAASTSGAVYSGTSSYAEGTVSADGIPLIGEISPSFFRADDGTWYDMDGNPQGPETTARLEAGYQDGSMSPTGEPPPAGFTEATGEGDTTTDSSADDGSGGSDDDDDDDGDGDEGEDPPADEGAGGDEASDETDPDSAGDDSTPHPDADPVDPAARAAFEQTPIGADSRKDNEQAIETRSGGGVTDPPATDDDTGSGGPLKGPDRGTIDPPETTFGAGSGGPIDEVRVRGGGAIDPPETADGSAGPDADPSGGRIPAFGSGSGPSRLDPNAAVPHSAGDLDVEPDDATGDLSAGPDPSAAELDSTVADRLDDALLHAELDLQIELEVEVDTDDLDLTD